MATINKKPIRERRFCSGEFAFNHGASILFRNGITIHCKTLTVMMFENSIAIENPRVVVYEPDNISRIMTVG